tara:strand:+ start:1625 stop:2512 length:888 start_codon:yes stop_codon:yes gene_type:complete
MIKPMLAHKFNPDKAVFPALLQPKLDGVRCVFTKEGAFSRTGKEFKNVDHIKETLKPLFKQHPWMILDGELYNHDLKDDFEKIISLVRKTKPTQDHKDEAEKLVQYHVYDIVSPNDLIVENGFSIWPPNYEERLDTLIDTIAQSTYNGHFLNLDHVKITLTVHVENIDKAKQWHEKFLNEGYEGSIYRNPDGLYKGTRSWDLMKFKDFSDAEATIVNYEIGKGKREGTLGKFIMQDEDGNIFGCPPGKGYNYQDLTNILDNIHDYMGQVATFTYFERTKAGSYRHPQFKCLRNYE